jgi:hypothetical protein
MANKKIASVMDGSPAKLIAVSPAAPSSGPSQEEIALRHRVAELEAEVDRLRKSVPGPDAVLRCGKPS